MESALGFARQTHLFEARKDLRNARGGDAVKDLLAASLVDDKPHVPQHGQVVRNRGGVAADQFSEVGNTSLAVGQRIDNQQPAGMAESLKNVGTATIFLWRARGVGFGFCGQRLHVWKNGKITKRMQL